MQKSVIYQGKVLHLFRKELHLSHIQSIPNRFRSAQPPQKLLPIAKFPKIYFTIYKVAGSIWPV